MAFTPPPTGWYLGIDMVLESEVDDNFVLHFMDLMHDNYGCVSAGGHNRRQVSHQRRAMEKAIIQLLINLLFLIQLVNTSDDTVDLLSMFVKSLADGGVFLAG